MSRVSSGEAVGIDRSGALEEPLAGLGGSLGGGGALAVPNGVEVGGVDVHGVPVDVHRSLLWVAGAICEPETQPESWNGLIPGAAHTMSRGVCVRARRD